MIQRLFEWKAPEQVKSLHDKNYTSILKLSYQPLLDYVHDYFEDYISDIVLDIDTNIKEEIPALEDIMERLLPENEELCFAVLEKEKAIWEDIKYCCSEIGEEAAQSKKKIWSFLLNKNRIHCTWDNFITYYDQYGSDACWVEYFGENIDILLNDIDSSTITENVLSALLLSDITENCFRKFISKVNLRPYEGSLAKLNKMKIKVLIEKGLLPYSIPFWDEMAAVASELRVFYAEKNKSAFIASLDNTELSEREINDLLQSEKFAPEDKNKLLLELDVAKMGVETAKIIKELKFRIDRVYTDAAWAVLEEADKYALLLNQIDAYQNDELPGLFAELAPVYQQFIDRTKHKYKLVYTDYNKRLLDKLVEKNYINRADEEWIDKEDNKLFHVEKQHVITGYVKQAKE